MKLTESWLREWVNPLITTEELAEQITMAGLEVEAIDFVAAEFTGVFVGRIIECQPHPNADKLKLTRVDIGGECLLDIVCGAINCRKDLVVACATVGALLPGNVTIKRAKLRGEISEGMLCSYSELGISEDSGGIIELPQDAVIGENIRKYLALDDKVIEMSITPNRADCLSIKGVARDIAAINQLPLNEPVFETVSATINDTFPIRIEAKEACPKYLGRVIKGVNVNALTPLWMKEKLRRCGTRLINPVVDITNYVLLELGQPMHSFDLNCVDNELIVRMAKEEESLILLDGNEAILSTDTLVIADNNKALAIAGIFGGSYSAVNDKTRDILLESAYFNPLAIAGRARRYGLHTDASHRYERGVDPQLQQQAIERATVLILAICGGHAGPIINMVTDLYLPKPAQITLRRSKLDSLIGYHIDDNQVTDLLARLGCTVTYQKDYWTVLAPSWRVDMEIEEDLVEEVLRLYGYSRIPNIPLKAKLILGEHRESNLSLKRVKMLLVDRGYQEAITYSFVNPKTQGWLHPQQAPLALPNPISQDMSVMRLSLWTGLLDALVYNQNRQQTRIRLFETGLRFIPDTAAELGIRQELVLAAIITGSRYDEHWQLSTTVVDFFDMKGDLEAILELTGQLEDIQFIAATHDALHPGQSAAIYLNSQHIGHIGVIHPGLEKKLGLASRTIVFEILWDKISQRSLKQATEISKFPLNRRDIAIVVAEHISAESILNECKKVGIHQMVGVNLFDLYSGKEVAAGYKSLAISLFLQDSTRTLEENDIAVMVTKCIDALKQRFQASLRE